VLYHTKLLWEGYSVKILVVDDEHNIVDILRVNLEREGYTVIAAYDGVQAIEIAITQKPDLILLDCMLPRMDGFDVCRKLRQQMNIPILMLTAKSEEIDKVSASSSVRTIISRNLSAFARS